MWRFSIRNIFEYKFAILFFSVIIIFIKFVFFIYAILETNNLLEFFLALFVIFVLCSIAYYFDELNEELVAHISPAERIKAQEELAFMQKIASSCVHCLKMSGEIRGSQETIFYNTYNLKSIQKEILCETAVNQNTLLEKETFSKTNFVFSTQFLENSSDSFLSEVDLYECNNNFENTKKYLSCIEKTGKGSDNCLSESFEYWKSEKNYKNCTPLSKTISELEKNCKNCASARKKNL